ncbi:MAG: metal-dependent transcriptional regulator [candidate division WOR-3 bacterium]|nr:metal-dependent transcriptional regulator [candidate division WOR-3 bacterium]
MKLSSSLEDYLEAILDIKRASGNVRVTDIAERLYVKKSSVNYAVSKLKNLNLVEHDLYEDIVLTEKGREKAKQVKGRHTLLMTFLHQFLGVNRKTAEKDACKIEHVISQDTVEKLTKFVDFMKSHKDFDSNRCIKIMEDKEMKTIEK